MTSKVQTTYLTLLFFNTAAASLIWGINTLFLLFSAAIPIRQTYLNSLIPSGQRATVLSFDSLFSSSGGVVIQPLLGKAADVWSYPVSYVFSSVFQACALPFTFLARREGVEADRFKD